MNISIRYWYAHWYITYVFSNVHDDLSTLFLGAPCKYRWVVACCRQRRSEVMPTPTTTVGEACRCVCAQRDMDEWMNVKSMFISHPYLGWIISYLRLTRGTHMHAPLINSLHTLLETKSRARPEGYLLVRKLLIPAPGIGLSLDICRQETGWRAWNYVMLHELWLAWLALWLALVVMHDWHQLWLCSAANHRYQLCFHDQCHLSLFVGVFLL